MLLSDPEEGNVIGNSHHKPPGGTEISEPKSPTNDEMVSLGEGEQSVLQAKLTNMAIQVSASSSIVLDKEYLLDFFWQCEESKLLFQHVALKTKRKVLKSFLR